jgi:hypothetical protein
MDKDLGRNSEDRYPVRMGINGVERIFKKYEVDLPVYEGNVRLGDLEHAQVAYTLRGDLYRRGDFFIALKDECMLPLWDKDDLVLLKYEDQGELIMGDRYYLLLEDGREIIGSITKLADLIIITPENPQYPKLELKRREVLKIYKVMEGLKREEAIREREKKR